MTVTKYAFGLFAIAIIAGIALGVRQGSVSEAIQRQYEQRSAIISQYSIAGDLSLTTEETKLLCSDRILGEDMAYRLGVFCLRRRMNIAELLRFLGPAPFTNSSSQGFEAAYPFDTGKLLEFRFDHSNQLARAHLTGVRNKQIPSMEELTFEGSAGDRQTPGPEARTIEASTDPQRLLPFLSKGRGNLTDEERDVLRDPFPDIRHGDYDEKAYHVAAICLRHRLSQTDITELMAVPEGISTNHTRRLIGFSYEYGGSRVLFFNFTMQGELEKVDGPYIDASSLSSAGDSSQVEVDAGALFKPLGRSVAVPAGGWGEEVLGFRIGLATDKASYLLEEPVNFTICLSNVTTRNLLVPPIQARPVDYEFIVLKSYRRYVDYTVTPIKHEEGGGVDGARRYYIQPGDAWLDHDRNSWRYYHTDPGEYDIAVIRKLKDDGSVKVRSGFIRIQIVGTEKH